MDLNGQKALVTGGSRGIGRVIAEKLKSVGAEVVILGSNEANLKQVASEMGVSYVVADLSDPEAPAKCAEEIGAVDILVNNAGITEDGLFMRQSQSAWDDVLQVNLTAAVQLSKAFISGMVKKRAGRIINISSVVAHMGTSGQTNYVAAKAGLTGFTKALAKEVGRRGITVNCVAPGFIETAMTDKLPEETQNDYKKQIPLGRFGTVDEVANAVLFLASGEASYVTGTTLHVNGGMYV